MNTFHGYTRSAATQAKIVAAIGEVTHAYPHQRLGQIIVNYVITGDLGDFFNLHDEEIIDLLNRATEKSYRT